MNDTRAHERQRAALIALGANPATIADTMRLIERAERRHHRKALAYCNEPQTNHWLEVWNTQQRLDLEALAEALPKAAGSLFINQDPRGYAVKIDNESEAERDLIHEAGVSRDWGGYGLLCREAYK